ncbi:SMI1/KNR4 family protein [Streptomyces acidicola]|uniref:hypothetical protein n=1 Tax=Streptomyces acidicola TaxID=2596892 RepID=UPI003830E520
MPIRGHKDEALAEAWEALIRWLAERAPTSYASLLPPAPEEDIIAADDQLKHHLGFGLPADLAALWRLCGGVDHQEIEHDEEGEVGSGAFLPGGVIMSPMDALRPRLPDDTGQDRWQGAPVVPWLTGDEAGPESGHWVGVIGVGRWGLDSLPGVGAEPAFPSIAAYLDAVLRTVTEGPADAMGPDVPGLVWGCLIWENPEYPLLDEALPHWTPIH